MISVTLKGLSVLQFENLKRFPDVFHFSTTRTGGSSNGSYSSLNLGFNSGDIPGRVLDNRTLLCKALELNSNSIIFPKQTHTATVKVINEEFLFADEETRNQYLQQTDSIITNQREICIAIKTADCVPVLLFDPRQRGVAAIHAGWRGTAENIVQRTIDKMVTEFGTTASDLIACIGPSISPQVYEVSSDVYRLFNHELYEETLPPKIDKRMLNLWKANHYQLTHAGVKVQNIETANLCTFSNPGKFYSARRDGAKTGRMATGIMLR